MSNIASEVRLGDCVELMGKMEPDSVDAIVTDPPYQLAFMGKVWDATHQHDAWATAAYRVAKPGCHLVAFGGTRTHHRLMCALEDAGWEIRDCLMWLYGSGFPKSHNLKNNWDGWGTALKPAWEPIVLARKPLAGTVARNVQEHGTGALNVDGCRIGKGGQGKWAEPRDGIWQTDSAKSAELLENPSGRWPANVVLDEAAAAMLDVQAPDTGAFAPVRGTEPSRPAKNVYGEYQRGVGAFHGYDRAGASRFFYTAKASRSEREAGLEGEHNHHPTVKPLKLMRWLCRLVTPPNGLILDPFLGSGTTGCAAGLEGFRFLGIEREAEYIAIAEKRIAHHLAQTELGV